MKKIFNIFAIMFIMLSLTFAEQEKLEEVSKKLDNPLSKLWLFFFKNDYDIKKLDDGSKELSNSFTFYPVMAFNVVDDWNFILRPSIHWLTQDGETKFADSQVVGMFGNTVAVGGDGKYTYALGGTISLPTGTGFATYDQYAAGISAMNYFNAPKYSIGFLYQYFAGINPDNGVEGASYSSFRYFLTYKFNAIWQLTTSPTISYDHKAAAGERLTFPIGVSLSWTLKIGNVPTRASLGFEKDVVKPDNIDSGTRIVFILTPVVPKYFGLWK